MTEKEFLKEKDLLLNCIENNTKEHWENYYKNVPIECIYNDLVIDINEIKRLTKENQELKSTNKVLSEELTKDKILKQDCLTTYCGIPIGDIPKLKNQQKEFIDYLTNYIKLLNDKPDLIEEGQQDILKEVLYKFKEIIGEPNENNT